MQLGDVRVLEALGRLVEERLDVVGVEELHEFAQRAAQRAIALGERRDARAVGVVDRLRGRQYGERLVRFRERRACVADDVLGLRPAAHHPRAGT